MPNDARTIKLYLVTDDADRALMAALCCSEADRPDWCAVLTDPEAIDRLPDGSRAIALWYSGRCRSKAERAWCDRRGFGGIVGLSDADMAWIEDWIARRRRQERQLALEDLPRGIDMPIDIDRSAEPESTISHAPDGFREMALSQRWV